MGHASSCWWLPEGRLPSSDADEAPRMGQPPKLRSTSSSMRGSGASPSYEKARSLVTRRAGGAGLRQGRSVGAAFANGLDVDPERHAGLGNHNNLVAVCSLGLARP